CIFNALPKKIVHKIIGEHLGWATSDAMHLRSVCKSLYVLEHPLTSIFLVILRLSKEEDFRPGNYKSFITRKLKKNHFSLTTLSENFSPIKQIKNYNKGFHRLLLISSHVNTSFQHLIKQMLSHLTWCPTACLHPDLKKKVSQNVIKKAEKIQNVMNYLI